MKKLLILFSIFFLIGCSKQVVTNGDIVPEELEIQLEDIVTEELKTEQIDTYDKESLLDCSRDEEVVFVDPVLDVLNNMSVQEKVGQLVIVGVEGEEVDERITELIVNRYVSGVCLFGRNISSEEQLIKLTGDLQELNKDNVAPLFIAIDEEGGRVSRLKPLGHDFPTAYSVGATGDKEYAYETGRSIGEVLKQYGINLNFAPVLDIHSNPNNPIIGDRAYGSDKEVVADMALSMYGGLQDSGILGAGKHFPGHGDTDVDSHTELPIVNKTKEELMELELYPFIKAIEEEIDMIMVAHIMEQGIDVELPSSMSEKIVTELLREELGYDGVVITDDIVMGAITNQYSVGEAAVKSIQAGVDIILVCHEYDKQIEVLESLMDAVLEGEISMKRLDESVYRVLKLKQKIKR